MMLNYWMEVLAFVLPNPHLIVEFPFHMCVYFQIKTTDVELTTWYSWTSTSHKTVLFFAPSPLVVPREVTTALYISVRVSDVINDSLYIACMKNSKSHSMFNNIMSLQAVCAATTDLNSTTDVANMYIYDYVFSTGTILFTRPQKASGKVLTQPME